MSPWSVSCGCHLNTISVKVLPDLKLTEMILQVSRKKQPPKSLKELDTWKIGGSIIRTILETHFYRFWWLL